jgi:hypothetical protein
VAARTSGTPRRSGFSRERPERREYACSWHVIAARRRFIDRGANDHLLRHFERQLDVFAIAQDDDGHTAAGFDVIERVFEQVGLAEKIVFAVE